MRRVTPWFIAGFVTLAFGLTIYILFSRSPTVSKSSPQPVVSAPSPEIDLRWVYINQNLKWESPPKEVGGHYQATDNGRLVIFFPNGKFASISCLIHRPDGSSKMLLIPNNGFGVYRGAWMRNADGTLTITSSLFSSNKMSSAGIAERGQQRVEQLIIRKFANDRLAERFDLSGQSFVSSPDIEGILELLSMPEEDI